MVRIVQPVALGVEILSLLIRAPTLGSFIPLMLSGDVRQVLHCDRPQAGRLADIRRQFVVIIGT
jgi:hypothetical protein